MASSKSILDAYKLKNFPFDLGRYDVERVGREAEWTRLLQIVQLAKAAGGPTLAVLLGTYGAGKSFMLWQLATKLKPAARTGVLASGLFRLVDPEQKKDFVKGTILRFFTRGVDLTADLVPLLQRSKLDPESAPSHLRPYIYLLRALCDEDSSSVARRVLTGGRALRKEAERGGFVEAMQIKTTDDAFWLLNALQMLTKSAGVDAIALLFDELEYIGGLPARLQATVLDSLKSIWDQQVEFAAKGVPVSQLLMIMAATPTYWQAIKRMVQEEGGRGSPAVGVTPFIARVRQSEIVEMPAELAADEGRQLIVNRMTVARAGKPKTDIIPFTDDYVDYVYRLSQGLPRQIIEICGVVLHEAAQRGVTRINEAMAQEILRDLLISYEPVPAAHSGSVEELDDYEEEEEEDSYD